MASNYWIKLYHEILDDPKMGTMDDHLYRRTIEMMLLAGDAQLDGLLPNVTDMSWRLRTTPEEIVTVLEQLEKLEIVHRAGDDWILTNFAERQAKMDAADRMRRMRDRKRKEHYYGDETVESQGCYDSVTNRNRKGKTEENRIEENRIDADKSDDAIFTDAQVSAINMQWQNVAGGISGFISEELVDLAVDTEAHRLKLPKEADGAGVDGSVWGGEAIKEAGRSKSNRYSGVSANFIRSILWRWMQEGYKKPFGKSNGKAQTEMSVEEYLKLRDQQ